MRIPSGLLVVLLLLFASPAVADEARLVFGGDQFVSGQAAKLSEPTEHDAFAAGFDVSLQAPVTGNAHLAGFNVASDAAITGDLYAAGQAVNVSAPVGGSVTAFGNSIAIRSGATVGKNARLAGATVTLSAPIGGSALITAQTLVLDTEIAGDFSFFGENLSFGPGARVTGTVHIQAPREIAVPDTVASADRVSFTQLVAPDYASQAGKTAEHVVQSIWPAVWATGLWWVLLCVIGLIFIALGNRLVLALENAVETRPIRKLGLGILVFAMVLGLVPVFALTLVGIFLLPFVLLFVFIAWTLAYVAGVYLTGIRVARALTRIDTNLKRVAVLVAAVIIAGLVGMAPIIGWPVTLLLLAFGFGAFGVLLARRWTATDRQRLTTAGPAAAPTGSNP